MYACSSIKFHRNLKKFSRKFIIVHHYDVTMLAFLGILKIYFLSKSFHIFCLQFFIIFHISFTSFYFLFLLYIFLLLFYLFYFFLLEACFWQKPSLWFRWYFIVLYYIFALFFITICVENISTSVFACYSLLSSFFLYCNVLYFFCFIPTRYKMFPRTFLNLVK